MIKNSQKSLKKSELICIELLNSFTGTELGQFSHFINCLYFNTDKSVVKLFEALHKNILHQKMFDDTMQKTLFNQVFGSSNIGNKLIKKEKKYLNAKLSLLKSLAEEFLAIEGLKESQVHFNDLLLKKLLDKGQNRLLERQFNQLDKMMGKVPQRNIDYYGLKKTIEFYRRDYLFQSGLIYKKSVDNLDDLTFHFDVSYLVEKLNMFMSIISLKSISSKKHNISSFDAIKKLLDLPQYNNNPLITLYKAAADLLDNKDQDSYDKLLKFLDTFSSITSKEDLIGFYNIALNHCTQQIQHGKFNYDDLFRLYLKLDDKDLLIENNFISIIKLKNITIIACRTNSFQKAESIIEKYRSYVKKAIRNSVCNYNYGIIAFYKKTYNKALQYFIRVDTINLDYDVNCRVIILKCHYEMDKTYDERTMQIFRSAHKFFKDNKQLTPQRKKSYRNFIQILIYIYKIKNQETKMPLSRAKEKLAEQDVNSDKNWLNTKIEELENVEKR